MDIDKFKQLHVMKKKILIVIIISMAFASGAQTNWDKIDLTLNGNPATIYNLLSAMTIKNDSECFIKSGLAGYNQYHNLQKINLITGTINLLDTYSIKVNNLFFEKQKLYGLGFGFWQFNFSTNKWDSINDFTAFNLNKQQNNFVKVSPDTMLIFGNKIAKVNTTTNSFKIVCDSGIYTGGCITTKNYYSLYETFFSVNKAYDSVFLMVSTDKGEQWNIRKRLSGNFDDSPILTFVNNDTGYISYITKPGTPPSQKQCHVIRTRDGGFTWPDTLKYFQQTLGNIWTVNDIYFLDKNIGFVSYGSSIFKTIDGGNIWYETPGVYTNGMKTFFINDSVGYTAVGKFYPATAQYILKTTNQGGPPYKTVEHTGVHTEEAEMVKINIHPNPNNGEFTVETPNLIITSVKVYDNNSKLVFVQYYNDPKHSKQIKFPVVAAGIYYIHVSTKEIPSIMTKVFVK